MHVQAWRQRCRSTRLQGGSSVLRLPERTMRRSSIVPLVDVHFLSQFQR
ncbi:hypothetical protein ANCCAN_29584 [Ancylostoma caninum]|uniref:Uncharacterized protein n=1 Tax=Ancylostoma caninum TaxID=29170 RepID=A0A368EY30_ANCCA|nr:hypothetical protein ANCCAN_29584 [Ancylostoma caninum]